MQNNRQTKPIDWFEKSISLYFAFQFSLAIMTLSKISIDFNKNINI